MAPRIARAAAPAVSRAARLGPSLIILAGAAATVSAGQALGVEMIAQGQRFVPLEGAKFDISPHTQTAVVASRKGNLIAPEGQYEVIGDVIYVSKDLAMAELAQASFPASALPADAAAALATGLTLAVPVAGVVGATLWYLLHDDTLRFSNSAVAVAYENDTSVGYTPSVLNKDPGSALVYDLTGNGADDERFTIDSSSGSLTFKVAPDYEDPSDANDDGIYAVEVRVTDGEQTAFQAVSLAVRDVNEAPVWITGSDATAAENSTATSYVAAGTDQDTGTSLSYSLTGQGPDDALFTIDPVTGELRFRTAPDFEDPSDADGDTVYVVQVGVSDGRYTTVQTVTLTLTNVNEAPTLTSGSSGSMDEGGTTTGYTATAADVDAGDTQTFSIVVEGADDSFFTIDPDTGVIGLNGALDFENPSDANGDGDYEFSIEVRDTDGLTDQLDVSMTLTDVNEDPVFENAGPFAVQENAAAATAVGDSDANDGDGGATDTNVLYSITGGTGLGLFAINATSGAITVQNGGTLDYETTASYTIEVTATDTTNTALTSQRTYTINLTDENEPPAFTSVNTLTIAENATSPTLSVLADDPEGDSITWSIIGGADGALFSISPSGELSIDAPENFEDPSDANTDNQHEVIVRATDSEGNTADQTITVSITNVNEAPAFTSGFSAAQDEGTTATGYIAAADDPEGASLTYAIVGTGADDDKLNIDPGTGALTFKTASDADIPGSAAGTNSYTVDLRVSDGVNDVERTVSISVNNINEAPSFSSVSTLTIAENATSPTLNVTVDDPEGDSITWSIIGGADGGLFSISPAGELSLDAAENFEDPSDANTDNEHEVTVRATDTAGNSADQTITVSITNVDEPATFTSGFSITQDEGTTATGYIAAADDPEGASLTYSIVGTGADDAKFTIDSSTGALTFIVAPDADIPGSTAGTNTYDVDLNVFDGSNNTGRIVSITVSDVNEAPEITGALTDTVAENTLITGYFATASDPESDGLSFDFAGSGADEALFTIDGSTGEIRFIATPNFENPGSADSDNVYEVDVEVSDGALTDVETVLITVTDQNESPVLAASSTTNMPEGQEDTGFVASAADVDAGDTLTYSLALSSATNDNALFVISGGSGALSFDAAPAFGDLASYNGSDTYTVDIVVTDNVGATDTETYFIVVDEVI